MPDKNKGKAAASACVFRRCMESCEEKAGLNHLNRNLPADIHDLISGNAQVIGYPG